MSEAERVVLDVPDISCGHCKMAIEKALAALEGVESVAVDVGARRVDVAYDGGRVDRERLAAAIGDEGYTVAGVLADAG